MDELTREELIAENVALKTKLADLENRFSELSAEVEMLRDKLSGGGNGSSAAPFIKPSRQQRRATERAERKKRKQSFARRRDMATEEVFHAVEHCPDCGKKLCGGYEQSRHQVLEIPREPVRIIDHVIIARRCGYCGKVHIPKLGISDGVVGKMRLGVGLMSLITTLSVAKRMPQRAIQKLLEELYGLHISIGEITRCFTGFRNGRSQLFSGFCEGFGEAPMQTRTKLVGVRTELMAICGAYRREQIDSTTSIAAARVGSSGTSWAVGSKACLAATSTQAMIGI